MTRLIPAVLAGLLAVFLIGCGGGGPTSPPTPDAVVIPTASAAMAGTGTAPARTLSTPEITITSGQSASLPVFVDDAAGLAGATLALRFDPSKIACTDATSSLAGVTVVANPRPAPGRAIVVLAGTTPASAGRQTLATFVLKAVGVASTTAVTLSGTVFDARGNAVASTDAPTPAAVLAAGAHSGIIGDLMGTGLPTAGSAVKVMNVVADLTLPPAASAKWQWDANQNGVVDPGDAVAILRCAAGIDPWPIGSRSAASRR